MIENNIIEKNTAYFGGGIALHGSLSATAAVVVNNTIYDNNATIGGGASFRDGAISVAFNNIFWLDSASSNREIHGTSGTVNVNNCDVAGGYAGTGNINVDPMFADSTFRLSDRSNCIGAGVDSFQIGSVWYREPSTSYYGLPRPNPAGSRPDIGACENARATPLTGVLETRPGLPTIFTLEQNYPNPFNPTTVISFQQPVVSKARLVVYDLLGREVAVLVNERKMPGRYELKLDASGLASGVYLYRLTVGSFVQTRKMIVLK
ncbi:MAG TPA: T9SS type A sorting domain-containing protein [Bacteroidota bacterium]